jgi:ABC-type Fe3+/spermidine/putrescine transport system ATPase subunit
MGDIDVELVRVTKTFSRGVRAVDDFSLSVPRGSFTTLLGPSGCGKTTLLRMIAGFFEPDSGSIIIQGKDQRGAPPEVRCTGIVFQDYALFPHMTIRENLAYGLTVRKVPAAEKNKETERVAGMLGISELLARFPDELSGGQQQRVALGRVLALQPKILLMDEPFSNLDTKLRVRVREELSEVQKKLGVTTIYVTHDQEEALALSDYIAVMRNGKLEQMGTPREIYNEPQTMFAADFSGTANFIEDRGAVHLVRPEWIDIMPETEGVRDAEGVRGVVESGEYLGRSLRLRIKLDSGEIMTAYAPAQSALAKNSRVLVVIQKKTAIPARH